MCVTEGPVLALHTIRNMKQGISNTAHKLHWVLYPFLSNIGSDVGYKKKSDGQCERAVRETRTFQRIAHTIYFCPMLTFEWI